MYPCIEMHFAQIPHYSISPQFVTMSQHYNSSLKLDLGASAVRPKHFFVIYMHPPPMTGRDLAHSHTTSHPHACTMVS